MICRFVILFMIIFFLFGKEGFGSILNPALSENEKIVTLSPSSFQTFIQLQFSRKLVVGEQPFNIEQENNLLDLLYIHTDLSVKYPVRKVFSQISSGFFSRSVFFFLLRYERLVYSGEDSIKQLCWLEVVCFRDGIAGFEGPLFKGNNLFINLLMYVKLPFSRLSIRQSFLLGAGLSLKMRYSMLSTPNWKLFVMSGHSFGLDAYKYRTANIKGTNYNRPLEILNQVGFQFFHTEYKWFPKLLVYGDYQLLMNFNAVFFHYVSLNTFLSWPLGQKMQVLLGLSWGDRILDQYNAFSSLDAKVFDMNRFFVHLGANYLF